VNLKDKS